MPDRPWTDADREAAGDALFTYLDRLGLDPQITRPYAAAAAVLDAVALRIAARTRAQVAQSLMDWAAAQLPPSQQWLGPRLAEIARQHATTGEEDPR